MTVKKDPAELRRLARGVEQWSNRSPFTVGVLMTPPEGLMGRKEDTFTALAKVMRKRDVDGTRRLCTQVVEESRTADLRETGKLDDKMQELVRTGRVGLNSSVLTVLEEAAAEVHRLYGEKALASDVSPERQKAMDQLQNANERLLEAAKSGDVEGVKKALTDGADHTTRDERGLTAMELAYGSEMYFDLPVCKHPQVVTVLREHLAECVKRIVRGTDFGL